MINRLSISALALGLSAFAWTGSLSAQVPNEQVANVPFSFNIADKTLPAGQYSFREMDNNKGVFYVRSASGQAQFLMSRIGRTQSPDHAKLVFHSIGDTHYLSNVWTVSGQEYTIPASAQEKQLERQVKLVSMVTVDLTSR